MAKWRIITAEREFIVEAASKHDAYAEGVRRCAEGEMVEFVLAHDKAAIRASQ